MTASWLLILVLTIWNLAAVFGQTHPDWSGGLRWGLAVLAALLFFGSVLLHELAHSLVARSARPPRAQHHPLSLWRRLGHPARARVAKGNELLMAIVGPLTSPWRWV